VRYSRRRKRMEGEFHHDQRYSRARTATQSRCCLPRHQLGRRELNPAGVGGR
jgi:hypothetical protein